LEYRGLDEQLLVRDGNGVQTISAAIRCSLQSAVWSG
jgi:hypothetical protein